MSESEVAKDGPGSAATGRIFWLCAGSGVLGGLAGGLVVALFLWLGGTREGVRASAREAAATPAPSPTAASEARESRFPARYDTLGVALGPEEAPVVVREFADYQCPYCAQFTDVTERIREEYVESGETSETIRRNLAFARTLGVRSTPTVVIGDRGFAGSRPWPEVRSLIEQALSAAADSSPASEPRLDLTGGRALPVERPAHRRARLRAPRGESDAGLAGRLPLPGAEAGPGGDGLPERGWS